jgi:hypothetical protein
MKRIAWWVRLAPAWACAWMAGCHLVLGLDDLELVDGTGGSAGGGGQGGSALGGGGTGTGTTQSGGEAGVGGVGAAGGSGGTGNLGGSGGSGGFGGLGGLGGFGGFGGFGGEGGGGTLYSHTITIGGTFDFDTGQWAGQESFPTTTNGFTAYYAWDAQNLYLGMRGPDIGPSSATKWVLVYIGGAPGTTTGVQYNTQQPTLPFPAHWHLRWKASNDYTDMMVYNGTSWASDATWSFTDDIFLSTAASNQWLEMRIPLAELGSPTTVDVHLSMINEAAMAESTYAGVPDTSFTDGLDRNYSHYFSFDLSGATPPNAHSPQ